MTDYNVKFTNEDKTPIHVSENSVDNSSTDITLFGRKKLEYGRDMNANFLHILENFACPENEVLPGVPDINQASFLAETNKRLLSTPVEGQMWYNMTQETLFVYDGDDWLPLGMSGDISANWGVINDGESLPRPVNDQGYVFSYDECSWIVSPFAINSTFTDMVCRTNPVMSNGNIVDVPVRMYYTPEGGTETSACANYMIVGIKGNYNLGTQPDENNMPQPTPPASPTPSVTPTISNTPLPSVTPSPTSTPGVSATPTPTRTRTRTRTPSPQPSGTPLPTPTRSPTRTPTRMASPTPTPTRTPSAYSVSISANPSGEVKPGDNICYTVSINRPATSGGYSFTLYRKHTNFTQVCASNVSSEISGTLIESYNATIPQGQSSIQICRTAPVQPPPTPTPTATARIACRKLTPSAFNVARGFTGAYCAGFLCANSSGGSLTYFTNSSGGSGNYNQCTGYCACNTATSYSSTQTIPINPVREGQQRYNATPAVQIHGEISVPGYGSTTFATQVFTNSTSSASNTNTSTVFIGDRTFTITLNMTATLTGTSGSNRTWKIDTNYSIMDNQRGVPVTITC